MSFLLSTNIAVSNNEIRCVIGNLEYKGINGFACGDRNNFLSTFYYVPENNIYKKVNSFKAHNSTISSLSYLPPCEWIPEGAILTASLDKTVCCWPMKYIIENEPNPSPSYTLIGHENNVCYVQGAADGIIYTCSWDGTARIWKDGAEIMALRHEEHGIWHVMPVPCGYVTFGADKSIRVFGKDGKSLFVKENAHNDVVRCGYFNENYSNLVSIANDGVLKEWNFDINSGEINLESSVTVSDTYLYSIAVVNEFYIVSGEDKCAYVINSTTKSIEDVLPVPGVAWNVSSMFNNDILLAVTDGRVYIFTQNMNRITSELEMSNYIAKLASLTFNSPDLENVNILDLEEMTLINNRPIVPGRFELMREGPEMVLVVYNKGLSQWLKVGTLTRNKGNQSQKVVAPDGKEYDFCFTVQVDEHGKSYPLYINHDTNHFVAAHNFIVEHNLPIRFLDEIANFIKRELKPHQVQVTQAVKPKSTVFPLKNPNYHSGVKTNPVVTKLRSICSNPVINENDALILSGPISFEWTEVANRVLMLSNPNESWPLLDILRDYILVPDAKHFIPSNVLIGIIGKFINHSNLIEFAVLTLMRVIGNVFMNYSTEIKQEIVLSEVFEKFSKQFSSYSNNTRVSFTNAIMNFTMFINDPRQLSAVADVIISILSNHLDDEPLYRILYAVGNICVENPSIQSKFSQRQELFAVETSEKCQQVISELVSILA